MNFRYHLEGKKIVLACDQLFSRRPYHRVLEEFAEIFPKAPLITTVHRVGAVRAVESRPVFSTGLSRFTRRVSGLKRGEFLWPYLIKGVCRSLSGYLGAAPDLIICVGAGHLVKLADHFPQSRLVHYLADWEQARPWTVSALDQGRQLILTASKCLGEKLEGLPSQHCYQGVDITQLSRPQKWSFPQEFKILATGVSSLKTRQKIESICAEDGVELDWLGPLDNSGPQLRAQVHQNSAVLQMDCSHFPELAICGLSQGRPFLALDCPPHREILPHYGGLFVTETNLQNQLQKLRQKWQDFDRPALSRSSVRYNSLRFRGQLSNHLSNFLQTP